LLSKSVKNSLQVRDWGVNKGDLRGTRYEVSGMKCEV
jgi:hypothetical protein